MRHGMSGRKLGRTSSHRKALFANLATELLRHEQIKTTLPKAKDLRSIVEPLITKACRGLGTDGELAARRQIMRTVNDEAVVRKLFDELAPKFKKRNGGYTRVLKAGFRKGDAAPMAVMELTERSTAVEAPKKEAKPAKKAKTETKEAKPENKTPAKAKSKKEEKTEK